MLICKGTKKSTDYKKVMEEVRDLSRLELSPRR